MAVIDKRIFRNLMTKAIERVFCSTNFNKEFSPLLKAAENIPQQFIFLIFAYSMKCKTAISVIIGIGLMYRAIDKIVTQKFNCPVFFSF